MRTSQRKPRRRERQSRWRVRRQVAVERAQPAAEEEHRGQRRDQDHVRVFGEEEQRERDARILDVEARDDLGLAFGHVERRAVRLGDAGDEIDDEQREQPEPVPGQEPPCCSATMSPRFRLPAAMSTPTSAKPMAISYATICAAERMAPRNAYLEFDAQPARITPYTPTEVSDSTYSRPASISAITSSGDERDHGPGRERRDQRDRRRDAEQEPCSTFAGMTTSLISSLMTSANG